MVLVCRCYYRYIKKDGVFLLRISDIDEPQRNLVKGGYRSFNDYFILKLKMICGDVLPPIDVRSKEKTGTDRYVIYDGYHRFNISKELGYEFISAVINDWDMNEFLLKEKIEGEVWSSSH